MGEIVYAVLTKIQSGENDASLADETLKSSDVTVLRKQTSKLKGVSIVVVHTM